MQRGGRHGPCDYNITQNFVVNYLWHPPTPKFGGVIGEHFLGGWEVSAIISAASGHWLDPAITDGSDPGGIGLGTGIVGNAIRPNQIGDPNHGAPHNAGAWFNIAAFQTPPSTQTVPGISRRNSILGPGRSNLDATIMKNIRVTEGSNFQFRLEAFNAINHTSFDTIDTTINDGSTFGTVTGAHQARIVQLALKFNF